MRISDETLNQATFRQNNPSSFSSTSKGEAKRTDLLKNIKRLWNAGKTLLEITVSLGVNPYTSVNTIFSPAEADAYVQANPPELVEALTHYRSTRNSLALSQS